MLLLGVASKVAWAQAVGLHNPHHELNLADADAATGAIPAAQDPSAAPVASVDSVKDIPIVATSPVLTSKEPVVSETPAAAANKVSGGSRSSPVDVTAAPVPDPSGAATAVSNSLAPTTVMVGSASDAVQALAPVVVPDVAAGVQGMQGGGPLSSSAVQQPGPIVQSSIDSSGTAYRLDDSTGAAGKVARMQQRSPASRAVVTGWYHWMLAAAMVMMVAW